MYIRHPSVLCRASRTSASPSPSASHTTGAVPLVSSSSDTVATTRPSASISHTSNPAPHHAGPPPRLVREHHVELDGPTHRVIQGVTLVADDEAAPHTRYAALTRGPTRTPPSPASSRTPHHHRRLLRCGTRPADYSPSPSTRHRHPSTRAPGHRTTRSAPPKEGRSSATRDDMTRFGCEVCGAESWVSLTHGFLDSMSQDRRCFGVSRRRSPPSRLRLAVLRRTCRVWLP